MYGFSTFASGPVPQNYAPQNPPFQNSAIAHRLLNQEDGRRPREPRFAQSSRELSFTCPEGHMTLPLGEKCLKTLYGSLRGDTTLMICIDV